MAPEPAALRRVASRAARVARGLLNRHRYRRALARGEPAGDLDWVFDPAPPPPPLVEVRLPDDVDRASALAWRRRQTLPELREQLQAQSLAREHELNHQLGETWEAAERLRGDLAVAREHLQGTLRELEAHKTELDSAREELEMWRRSRQAFDRKLPVRFYHAVRRLLGR